MNLFKYSITCLVIVIFLGCKTNQKEQFEIKEKIKMLYDKKENFYEIQLDSNLFSEDLINQMKSIKLLTDQDIQRIKNSDSPTDKPVQLEGSIFTSLSDGYSKYTIKEIKVSGKKATVFVEFEYPSTPKEIWVDKVFLDYNDTWRITNIEFSTKFNSERVTLKDTFSYFINIFDTIENTLKDKNGNLLKMVFLNSKNIVTLYINDEVIILNGQRPASGIWYENQEYELRGKGNQLTLSKLGKVVFTTDEEEFIPIKEAKNYFLFNNYKELPLHNMKITNQKVLDSFFGKATNMGSKGSPTPIDFTTNYVVAIIDKTASYQNELTVQSISKLKDEITIALIISKSLETSYKSRSFKLLIIPNKYQGKLKLKESH